LLDALLNRNVHHRCWRNFGIWLRSAGSAQGDTGGSGKNNCNFHGYFFWLLVGLLVDDFLSQLLNWLNNNWGSWLGYFGATRSTDHYATCCGGDCDDFYKFHRWLIMGNGDE